MVKNLFNIKLGILTVDTYELLETLIVFSYTQILTIKFVLLCFFINKMSGKIHNSTEMEK